MGFLVSSFNLSKGSSDISSSKTNLWLICVRENGFRNANCICYFQLILTPFIMNLICMSDRAKNVCICEKNQWWNRTHPKANGSVII